MRLLRIRPPFDHPDFIFEPKLDGFRVLAHVRYQHSMDSSAQSDSENVDPRSFARFKDIIHVIALQSSSKTTADEVVLTVNVAVIAPAALHSWEPPFSVTSGHWRARLGVLGPNPLQGIQ